ncbi:hypothetical protein TWF694_010850 [Orbilia ellipsospora]|uniref:Cytochrome c oxidase assembly protein COX20, mitochondrial n=1 Tax=Orbilia ellipsospora TaxID=2528407 RepID=A0AAV9X796_9PEZI
MANNDDKTPLAGGSVTTAPSSPQPLPDPSTVGQLPPKQADPTFWDASKTISGDSFTKIHYMPCARQAWLTGIAAGFAFGGVRLFLRASVWNACSWTAGAGTFTGIVIWEACRWKRGREKDGMIRAMQIMEYKRLEREKKLEERREQQRLKEEEERRRKEAVKNWWKPW